MYMTSMIFLTLSNLQTCVDAPIRDVLHERERYTALEALKKHWWYCGGSSASEKLLFS